MFSGMSKTFELALRIKNLKHGESFSVAKSSHRDGALRIGKILWDSEVIDFKISSRKAGSGKFTIFAV